MKKAKIYSVIGLALLAALLTSCSDDSTSAETDTFDASVVCPANLRGTFVDERDGQVYKYTTIGNQVWMAENLKFDAPYSLCYERTEGFCDTFGRFYSLHVNGNDLDFFDQELLDTICPAGWHVPSIYEWQILSDIMGGGANAVARLNSSENFGERYKLGTDECGFNSLPAGAWLLNGQVSDEYVSSAYWTSTAKDFGSSYECNFIVTGMSFHINSPKMSIRCIKD